jgi:hypothetical protein
LHTELRVCLSCIFVTDSDSEMTAHLHDYHHQTSPTHLKFAANNLIESNPIWTSTLVRRFACTEMRLQT